MKKTTAKAHPVLQPHGLDLNAPGALEQLFALRRQTFGDALMQEGAGGEGGAGDGGAGGGGAGAGGGEGGAGGEGNGPGKDGDEQLGEPGKRALDAERATNKQLKADIAARENELKELRDAGKSEEDKRSERYQQLEATERQQAATIADQQSIIDRYRIAAIKGLDLEAAERLRGKTAEEIEKDADAWIKKWGTTTDPQTVPGAGARGSDRVQTTPGLGTLRAGYAEKK